MDKVYIPITLNSLFIEIPCLQGNKGFKTIEYELALNSLFIEIPCLTEIAPILKYDVYNDLSILFSLRFLVCNAAAGSI